MKNFLIIVLLIFALFVTNSSSARVVNIILSNSSKKALIEKSVVIKRAELEKKNGALSEGRFAWLINDRMVPVVAQLDDLDGDGKWDELFAQVNLKPKDKKAFRIEILEERTEVKTRTNIRFADINNAFKEYSSAERLKSNTTEISQKYFQFEGPGWENDVIAFRNYFDERNGIDIFGKTTTNMVLDSCGLKGGATYHEMRSWGMDILKVANSLGAGALAFQTRAGLYRLGPNCKGTYHLVVEGPIRSIIDLDFEGVQLSGKLVDVKHRISIEAGKPYYKSQVLVKNSGGLKLVTGIVNLQSKDFYKINGNRFSSFYTFDNQAYDGEKLGMAIIVPHKRIDVKTAQEEGEGITQTFYTVLPIDKQPLTFYFMAGWEKQNASYSTKAGFEKAVNEQAKSISIKLKLKLR